MSVFPKNIITNQVLLLIIIVATITCIDAETTLWCEAFDVQLHGGIAPISWQGREPLASVSCPPVIPSAPSLLTTFPVPKFTKFFHIPWTIGIQGGYAYSDTIRFYFEFNYLRAHAKSARSTRFAIPQLPGAPEGIVLNFVVGNYTLFDYYVGARYYFDNCWCNRISLFLGAKVGCTQRQKTHFSLSETIPNFDNNLILVPTSSSAILFKSRSTVSGGVNVGVDFCVTENLNFAITGELVANCGPKSNIVAFTPSIPINTSHILIGNIDTELRFPITAALRYSF